MWTHGQGKVREKVFFFKVTEKSGNFEIGQGKMIFWAKVREFYDEGALVVQLLSFIDQKAKTVSSICIIVVIINIYTHVVRC